MSKKKSKEKQNITMQEIPAQIEKNYGWLNYIMLAVGTCIILYIRIMPYKKYFLPDSPFKDTDTCYHLRRIIYAATHNMQFPFYDPLLAHPHGAIPIWSPLYDWFMALPSFLLGLGNPSALFVQRISMIMALLIGLAVLVLIAMLTYRATNNMTTAFLAALLAGLTDAQVKFTSIEIIDHNSLVLLLYVLILYKTYSMFCKEDSLHFFKDTGILAMLLALLFWVWPGSYVHLGVIALIHFIYAFWRRKINLFNSLAQAYLVSSVLIAPLALIHYHFGKELLRFEYVSLFTVLFLVLIAAGFYLTGSLLQWKKGEDKKILLFSMAGAVLLIAALVIIIYRPAIEGIQFARAQNAWLSTVSESKPLFYQVNGAMRLFFWANAIGKLNYLLFVFPIAFFFILFRYNKVSVELYVLLMVNSVIFGYLAWSQTKFAFDFTFCYGIVLSIFFIGLYKKIAKTFSLVLVAFFAVAIIASLIPLKKDFKELYIQINAYYPPFHWLKLDAGLSGTEINTGHVQPDGVMAPWDLGHYLHLYSEMPTITDNFGTYLEPSSGFYDTAKFFLSDKEDKAVRILKKYKASYVVVPLASTYEQHPVFIGLDSRIYYNYNLIEKDGEKYIIAEGKPEFGKTIGYRLSDMWGSANPYEDEKLYEYQALKHFRLLYASPEAMVAGQKVAEGSLKIYKYVKGTPLHVNVTGNPPYKLDAVIRMSNGVGFSYRQKGYVNDGIIAPYPTRKIKDYPYAEFYQVFIEGRTYSFYDVE